MTALTEREPIAPVVTDAQLELVRKTVANGATADELKIYLYDCQRQGVHPLDRLLHFTKRGGKYTPVTSIDLMRIRAAETGEYAGSDDAVFDMGAIVAGPAFAATVTVWRLVQGQRCGFTATARWSEYFPGEQSGHMWKKMPHTMLAKCAEGLALRKGFPRQLAGLYAKEELDQAGPSNGDQPAYSVEAPTAPAAASSSGRTPALQAENAGSIPAAATKLPPGAVLITKVDSGTGSAKAFVFTSAMPTPYDKGLPIYKEQLASIAQQRYQDKLPVHLTLTTPKSGGPTYIAGITDVETHVLGMVDFETGEAHDDDDPIAEMLKDSDIPFAWIVAVLLSGGLWV